MRLTDRTPSYVGTWDINNPCGGYFEMFIDANNGVFKGEIIDCIGDADIEGTRTGNELKFVKRYREGQCTPGAVRSDVTYKGIIRGDEIIGFFAVGGYGERMYMRQTHVQSPLELGMIQLAAEKKYLSEIKELGKRFFKE